MSQPARKIKCYTLCQDGFDKVSVNVRQPEVAPLKAVRELFVRDAEQMQYRGVQVVHVHDLHATILHLLGIPHKQLTYRFQGRDFRLTDVHGNLVKPILT